MWTRATFLGRMANDAPINGDEFVTSTERKLTLLPFMPTSVPVDAKPRIGGRAGIDCCNVGALLQSVGALCERLIAVLECPRTLGARFKPEAGEQSVLFFTIMCFLTL